MTETAHYLAQVETAYALFLAHGLAKTSKRDRTFIHANISDHRNAAADGVFDLDAAVSFAAACYAAGRIPQAVYSKAEAIREASGRYGSLWPWDGDAWKPRGRRDNLIRAGALILAEIERLDRINPK